MYATTHNTFESAAQAYDEHKAAFDAAKRSIVRCRKASSIEERAAAITHHKAWMVYLGDVMSGLVWAN